MKVLSKIVMLGVSTLVMAAQSTNYVPKAGYVPDEKTAVAIAEAVLLPIYGDKQINSEKPLHARLGTDDVWVVEGMLAHGGVAVGGVATVKLRRSNGQILFVSHGK